MGNTEFSDNDARLLLQLLHKYAMNFEPDVPVKVEHLAEDLVQSLDRTTDRDDEMYQEICRVYHWDRVATAPQDKKKGGE